MKYIGISLGNNTSACVVSNMGVEFAISEERLINEKNTKKFPINALKKCIQYINPHKDDDIIIGICSYEIINDRTLKYIDKKYHIIRNDYSDFDSFLKAYILNECNIYNNIIIKRVEHHEAHRLPGLYLSGFLLDKEINTIVVTYDGFGDGLCASIYDHSTNEILARKKPEHSLGLIYQYVTGALGFKEHQHEGKITGLAAFGAPIYVEEFKRRIVKYDSDKMAFINGQTRRLSYDSKRFINTEYNKNIADFDRILELKSVVYSLVEHLLYEGASKENIASSVQSYTEELLCDWLDDVLTENNYKGKFNLALSGGLFANVKINYKIKERLKPNKLFIVPPMGDEGTAIGAGIKVYLDDSPASNIYSLQSFSNDKCNLYMGKIRELQKPIYCGLNERYFDMITATDVPATTNMSKVIANLLSEGKIVCLSGGDSEFGPRALGNHSILFDASSKSTNDLLNKKLGRTEFMPFAPITIDQFVDDLFIGVEGIEKALKYMTIAVPVTKEFTDNYKAAYHVDYTARPQVVHPQDNTFLYHIILEYYKITGKKVLINTSFNLHNFPIVHSDEIALESFMKADLDVLLLNDRLIIKRDQEV